MCLRGVYIMAVTNSMSEMLKTILEYYEMKFYSEGKDGYFVEQCKSYVRYYFTEIAEEFNNVEYKTVLNLLEEETELLRKRFGVYGKSEISKAKKLNVIPLIEKFQRNVFAEIDEKLKIFIFMLGEYGKYPFSK